MVRLILVLVGLTACQVDKQNDTGENTTPVAVPVADAGPDRYIEVGYDIEFSIGDSIGDRFVWRFDGGDEKAGERVSHTFEEPGRKRVVLTAISNNGTTKTDAATIIVHTRPTNTKAIVSRPMIRVQDTLWMVFPEGNALFKVDLATLSVSTIGVCTTPERLAYANQKIAVSCPKSDAITVIDTLSNTHVTWPFPTGSAPFGIIGKDQFWWVSLRGSGILQKWRDDVLVNEVETGLGPDLRDFSLSHNGTIFAPRWRSVGDSATILRFNADNLLPLNQINLPKDENGDSDNTTNGIPNLLGEVRPSPDGEMLYVPMLHANIDRGEFTSGQEQTHETMLRAVLARLPSDENVDNPDDREQFDERGRALSALPSPLGDTLYTLHPGTQHITILDAVSFENIGAILNVGAMPIGMELNEAGETLFVYAWLDRRLTAYDITTPHMPATLWQLDLVEEEPLPSNVLKGKKIFFDAQDKRITKSGYIACSNCHPSGEHDGQTWDFSGRGEGLRNTHTLEGVAQTGQIHWTGNFDEFQDFEHDFRDAFGGNGFLNDALYELSSPLAEPKAGQSDELDALSAYLMTLETTPTSPFPPSDNGAYLFNTAGCNDCHSGPIGSDSNTESPIRHDVGTASAASGGRLHGPYDGFDTPSLNGLWATAPYLHDGSASSVKEAISAHLLPEVDSLSETELQAISDYVLSR